MHEDAVELALADWRQAIGDDNVLGGEQAERRYGGGLTAPARRRIIGAIKVRSTEYLAAIVRISSQHAIPLYPISTGRNWGYGGASPVRDGCAIVDLSSLDQILDFDAELGLVTVQPGVTQRKLREYLDAHAPEFLVPVHGGGPECSLLGNAIERGYGITPYADHFGALTSLEALLPNGEIYRPLLATMGGSLVDASFKWGVGPYLDGLFTQSNFGLVTQATFALARAPQCIEAFYFWINDDRRLERSVVAVRETLRQVGGVTGMINLMDTRRVLSMLIPYPKHALGKGQVMPDEMVSALARLQHAPAWMGVGALYGTARVVRAARKDVKRHLKAVADRLIFVSPNSLRRLRTLLRYLPWKRLEPIRTAVDTVYKAFDLMAGVPSQVALPLAYWKSAAKPIEAQTMDPGKDGCGLIWYSPLVPMKPDCVRKYVSMVNKTCVKHGIEPLITLTSISNGCFDSTVPLLFDREDLEEAARANACYQALFDEGRKMGILPYRVGVQQMGLLADPQAPACRLAATLKHAIDPQGIMSPGRYSIS